MGIRFTISRLIALPLRHKLIAGTIVVVFITGYLMWVRHLSPQEYISSALLFFDRTVAPKPDRVEVQFGKSHATELAKSILSDDIINAICKHFGLFPDSSGTEAVRFRSNLVLSGESTSSLRVTWRGTDRAQTISVTNTLAVLLSSWVPEASHQNTAPTPPLPASITAMMPIQPEPPVQTIHAKPDPAETRLRTVLNEKRELETLLTAADKRLVALADEVHRLAASIGHANTESQVNITARQPLTERLATEKKKLDVLRVRYTDAYPDVEAAQERIAETEQKLATMPGVRPPSDVDQSRLNAVTKEIDRLRVERGRLSSELSKKAKLETTLYGQEVKGSVQTNKPNQASTEPQSTQGKSRLTEHAQSPVLIASNSQTVDSTEGEQVHVFRILERAADAQPTNDPRALLKWLVGLTGPFCGVLYLLTAVRWCRTVRNAETLEKIVPENVAYLGGIPGMNKWRQSI